MNIKNAIYLTLFMTVNALAQPAPPEESLSQSAQQALNKKELTLADRKRWRQLLHWPDDCEEHFSGYGNEFAGLTFHKLNDNQYIVEVTCIVGAYQGSHLFYWIDDSSKQAHLLELEQYTEIESLETPAKVHFEKFTDALVWGTTLFNSEDKQLINLNRYRGVGGCGTRTVYKVDTPEPKVVEFRARVNCTPEYVPPKQWKRYPLEQIADWPIGDNPLRAE